MGESVIRRSTALVEYASKGWCCFRLYGRKKGFHVVRGNAVRPGTPVERLLGPHIAGTNGEMLLWRGDTGGVDLRSPRAFDGESSQVHPWDDVVVSGSLHV